MLHNLGWAVAVVLAVLQLTDAIGVEGLAWAIVAGGAAELVDRYA